MISATVVTAAFAFSSLITSFPISILTLGALGGKNSFAQLQDCSCRFIQISSVC
jgi:hypothetical protein